MRRLLGLAMAALVGMLGWASLASSQQGEDEFGVLKTAPAKSAAPASSPTTPGASPAPRNLPQGIEPNTGSASPRSAPENPYPVTPDAGAWMICAATYIGPDGPVLSRQVATELREKHQLATYIFNRGDEERRKQDEEFEAMKKRYNNAPIRKKIYRVQDQYAVLIGGFKDFESASAFLPKVRKMAPPKLQLEEGKNPYEVMTYQDVDPETKKQVTKSALVNPYSNAMVVRNPAAPPDSKNKPKWDPFWKQLNAHEEYSLLKNPSKMTLVIKEYMGARTLQQQQTSSTFLNALGLGGSRPGEHLDGAAQQAHELARFLRQPSIGMTSYVLHTRYSSVVTIGGFENPDDPEMQRLARMITNLKFSTKNGGNDPIGLLPSPIPVEVPRP